MVFSVLASLIRAVPTVPSSHSRVGNAWLDFSSYVVASLIRFVANVPSSHARVCNAWLDFSSYVDIYIYIYINIYTFTQTNKNKKTREIYFEPPNFEKRLQNKIIYAGYVSIAMPFVLCFTDNNSICVNNICII